MYKPPGILFFLPVGNFRVYGYFDWEAVAFHYLRAFKKANFEVKAVSTMFSDMRGWDGLHSTFLAERPENYVNVVCGPIFDRFWTANKINVAVLGGWPIPDSLVRDIDKYAFAVCPTREVLERLWERINIPLVLAPPTREGMETFAGWIEETPLAPAPEPDKSLFEVITKKPKS